MTRFHATDKGNVPFTPEEELARDAEEAQAAIDKAAADKAQANEAIKSQLDAADLKIIRALTEGDQARIDAHKAAQATLRAQLRE